VRLLAIGLAVCLLPGVASAQAWWDTSWSNRLRLTFDNSAQATNLASFPVLVVLNSARINYTDARANGEDLRFIDADGTTVLAHEIESWDPSGISYVWVNVPQIDANSSADYIFVYYGNPSAADGQNAAGVWDTDFKMVQHLNETAGAHLDSTTNANDSVVVNVTLQGNGAGKIGGGDTLIDTNLENIDVADSVTLDVGPTESMTAEAWIRVASTGQFQFVANKKTGSADWQLHVDATNLADFWVNDGTDVAHADGVTAVADLQWHYLVGRWDETTNTAQVFVDGSSTGTATNGLVGDFSNNNPLVIGEEGDASRGFNLGGNVDEVRFSKAARSDAWIAAQHLSMTDAFITYGNPSSQSQVQTGSYVGDGTDDRVIFGVGFAPDVVIIKGDQGLDGVIRTATMVGDIAKPINPSAAAAPNNIQSLDADGFTIGTDARVNQTGVAFQWMAFKAAPGQLTLGSYTGDGNDNRSIVGVGFQPDYVVTVPEGGHDPFHRFASQVGDNSTAFGGGVPTTDRIQLLEPDGFQLGGWTIVNGSGEKYHYAAWKAIPNKMAFGSYAGDGNDNRSIPGVGFSPELVIVQREAAAGNTRSVAKPASTGVSTDESMFLRDTANQSNNIQALEPDGFQVGNVATDQ